MIQDPSRSLYKKQLLSHRNQSGVLFQLTFILRSMIQVMLMNVIASFLSLSTIIFRLNTKQVLRSYLQAHLDVQRTFRFTDNVQRNLSSYVQVVNMEFSSVFITCVYLENVYFVLKSTDPWIPLQCNNKLYVYIIIALNKCLPKLWQTKGIPTKKET